MKKILITWALLLTFNAHPDDNPYQAPAEWRDPLWETAEGKAIYNADSYIQADRFTRFTKYGLLYPLGGVAIPYLVYQLSSSAMDPSFTLTERGLAFGAGLATFGYSLKIGTQLLNIHHGIRALNQMAKDHRSGAKRLAVPYLERLQSLARQSHGWARWIAQNSLGDCGGVFNRLAP